jgi:hypothetical protein
MKSGPAKTVGPGNEHFSAVSMEEFTKEKAAFCLFQTCLAAILMAERELFRLPSTRRSVPKLHLY